MDHPLIARPPAPTPAPTPATATEPSAAELLAKANALQSAVDQINNSKKAKNLIFVAIVAVGIASLFYWGFTGTNVNNNKTNVDLGCIELRKLHPTAKCPGEDGYASLPPAANSPVQAYVPPPTAYVPPPRDTPRPAPQPQAQVATEKWGETFEFDGKTETRWSTTAGRMTWCAKTEAEYLEFCLDPGLTAPGAVLDHDKCGSEKRVLRINSGKCAKISKST